MSYEEILKTFGPQGISDYQSFYRRPGAATSGIQTMLFVAESIIRSSLHGVRSDVFSLTNVIHNGLLRWLHSQGQAPHSDLDSDCLEINTTEGLLDNQRLWSFREPPQTCMKELAASTAYGQYALNNNNESYPLLWAAPCAFSDSPFVAASEAAKLTHGHPAVALSAGILAEILSDLCLVESPKKSDLVDICRRVIIRHNDEKGFDTVSAIIEHTVRLSSEGVQPTPAVIDGLGDSASAEVVLASGLWFAFTADNFREGVLRAANHSGKSAQTAQIAGHVLGLTYGLDALPSAWLIELELREEIISLARDLVEVPLIQYDERYRKLISVLEKYPGFNHSW
tara:strand:- start:722 stop:1741 length:1020 start_codon:yes stop_codon:yes gene_type:complete